MEISFRRLISLLIEDHVGVRKDGGDFTWRRTVCHILFRIRTHYTIYTQTTITHDLVRALDQRSVSLKYQ